MVHRKQWLCGPAITVALIAAACAIQSVQTRAWAADHWAFRRIARPALPTVGQTEFIRTPVDAFLLKTLEQKKLVFGSPADRATLFRRLTFDVIGLPPRPDELKQFVADTAPDAYARAVERLLASPHYGERWGKYWLDVVGYADSNGYFNADTDRPFAYRYRDYVIRSLNADKPFDQFLREQLAGDELAGNTSGKPITPREVELFTATHFLRNSQDGTGESDGNPDERRVDRATALQGTLQITMNSLLGLTIQCCRCHDHKFEPIQQAEYYRLQSIFYPAFPAYDSEHWVKPKDRLREMPTADELSQWSSRDRHLQAQQNATRREFAAWVASHRPPEAVLFRDEFDTPGQLHAQWSNTAPGDDHPGGEPPVALDSSTAPGAAIQNGALAIIESGSGGDRWLVTKQAFDWKPNGEGEWIQATFDLVANHVGKGSAAERIGYFLAAHDFNDDGGRAGGNILIDGDPDGGAAVHVDYPGQDAKSVGSIGKARYEPGHRYGVRITNVGGGKYRLEQVVDFVTETQALTLDAADLPSGAFGFEYCCGRSFVVDNVLVERSSPPPPASTAGEAYRKEFRKREKRFRKALAEIETSRKVKPGSLACVTDIVADPPPLHLLKRGNYTDLGEVVVPAGLTVLSDGSSVLPVHRPFAGSHSTGRRLAFAHWLTDRQSRVSSLLARVMVNRLWQRHFGRGLVATPDNFGLSGSPPSHPELLEYLAAEFRDRGWSVKTIHRMILLSAAYQQSSASREPALAVDPDDRLLWRYPLQRLDAEAVRDAMLTVCGQLSEQLYGPYVPTRREEDGNVVVPENQEGSDRRGVYLQQRRTQVNTFMELFDAPVMVNNCAVRGTSTVPLQSLALLNSAFVRSRATSFAEFAQKLGVRGEAESEKVRRTLARAFSRPPTPVEQAASIAFLKQQKETYGKSAGASEQAWDDFCQMLLASNAFLYVE